MDLEDFQINLWTFLAHKINSFMATGVEDSIADAEIAVKPQLQ